MTATLVLAAAAYTLWVLFLAMMALKHSWTSLPPIVKALAVPAVAVAIVLDIAFNLAATLPFADLPAEWTFSQRMGRYKAKGFGWRARAAQCVCSNLLDPFEIGGHCR